MTTPAPRPRPAGRLRRPLVAAGRLRRPLMAGGRLRRPTRTELLLGLAFLVLVGGVVQGYVFGQVGADERVLVASLEPGVTAEERERVRTECGGLPGVSPVADQGSGRTGLLERFPLRFSLSGATAAQESALQSCLARFDAVRGVTTEGRP